MKHTEKNIHTETAAGSYDLALLEEMEDNEYLQEVLTIWLTESPRDIKDMKVALQDGNIDITCKKAHKLKSSAGVIQAGHLKTLLENIEAKGKQGAPAADLSKLLGEVEHEYNSIEGSLKIYLEGLARKIA